MAANRLPASLMNALDPAAGARRSRLTAARAGAPRCPYISRRSRPASGQTVTVPSSFRRGELPRRLRAPFARNVIPGVHAVDWARGYRQYRPHRHGTPRRWAGAQTRIRTRWLSGNGLSVDTQIGIRVSDIPREPERARLCRGTES